MAPEIALEKISSLKKGQTILDPMCGSGMVLSQAAKHGLMSIGYDLDPLARLISRVGATRIKEEKARNTLAVLLSCCEKDQRKNTVSKLSWIDKDEETFKFVRFWFNLKQEHQLRLLSKYLVVMPVTTDPKILNILKVAVSRLIITKEPKASLARDTAHSRPHRTITSNDFDIFEELPASLNRVLRALHIPDLKTDAKTYLGDARKLTRIKNSSVDAIITSPPYLNAIDYMRGHKLSLVWWGYSLDKLRKIRSSSIGAERMLNSNASELFENLVDRLRLTELDNKNYYMLWRYFVDLTNQTKESARVLKTKGTAMYVIGNSNLKGIYIQNSEMLKTAAELAGLKLTHETTRKILDGRRYLPMQVHSTNALSTRMRTEHIIEFSKAG